MLNIHDTNHTKATRPPLAMPQWSLEECQSTNKKKKLCFRLQSLPLSPFLSATHPKARPGPAPWDLLQPAKPTPACIIIIFHQLCKRCPAECACNRAPSGPAPKRMQMRLPAGVNWPPPLPVSAALPWYALLRVKQPGTLDPRNLEQQAPWASSAEAWMFSERVVRLLPCFGNLNFLTWTWSSSQRAKATA